jgi:hypothetical protein
MRTRSLLTDTRGKTTVEYLIVLCLLAVVGFGTWRGFGETVEGKVAGARRTLADEDDGGLGSAVSTSGGSAHGAASALGLGSGGGSGGAASRAAVIGAASGAVGAASGGLGTARDAGRGVRDGVQQFVSDTLDTVGAVASGIAGVARDPRAAAHAVAGAVSHAIDHPDEVARAAGRTASAVAEGLAESARQFADAVRRGDTYEVSRSITLAAGSFIPGGPVMNGARAARAAATVAATTERAAGAVAREVRDVAAREGRRDDGDGAAAGAARRRRGYASIHPPPPAWLQRRFDATVEAVRRGEAGPESSPEAVRAFLQETWEHSREVRTLTDELGGYPRRSVPDVEPRTGTNGIHDFGERVSARRLDDQIQRWREQPLRDSRTGEAIPVPDWVSRLPDEARARGDANVDIGKLNPHIAAGLAREPADRYALELHRSSAHHSTTASPNSITVVEQVADVVNARRQPRFYRVERGDPDVVTPFETIERDLIRDVDSGRLPETARPLIPRAVEAQRRLEIEGRVNPYHEWSPPSARPDPAPRPSASPPP